MSLHHLKCTFKNYSWGSLSGIQGILGIPSDGKPLAEVWMGSHPGGMSLLKDIEGKEMTLGDFISSDPERILGSRAAVKYGRTLPFLFKLLCIEKPCSVQAHPDTASAAEGFARENEAGIPLESPERTFKDPGCKKEMVLALTPFYLLNGFRPAAEIRKNFPGFVPDGAEGEDFYRAFMEKFLSVPVAGLTADTSVLDSVGKYIYDKLVHIFPEDRFIYAPFFLNTVRLEPGEAIAVGEGQLHSYVEGMCFELMTSSDNTLRGGLTEKFVNIPELLKVLRFREEKSSLIGPSVSDTERIFCPGFGEFSLSEIKPGEKGYVSPDEHGLEIMFVYSGSGTIDNGTEKLSIKRGDAVAVSSDTGKYRLEGTSDLAVYKGAVPL